MPADSVFAARAQEGDELPDGYWRAWLHDGYSRLVMIDSRGEVLREVELAIPPAQEEFDNNDLPISFHAAAIM